MLERRYDRRMHFAAVAAFARFDSWLLVGPQVTSTNEVMVGFPA